MASRRSESSNVPAVGARVRFQFGGREIVGIVVEHRGPLGYKGQQLLRVRIEWDVPGQDPTEFEIPASDVKAAA